VAWESGGFRLATSAGRGRGFDRATQVFRGELDYVAAIAVAVDSARRAVVAWNADEYRRFTNVHAAIVDAGGRRRGHVRFRGRADGRIPRYGTAALDEHGRGTVVWVRGHEVRAAHVNVER
jgi:hypothetical protein